MAVVKSEKYYIKVIDGSTGWGDIPPKTDEYEGLQKPDT